MIINMDKTNGGGGSGSGVTPQEVQQQIDSALTPYWESAETQSAITEAVSGLASEEYVQEALSGVNLENYYTSAQTEEAITSKNYVTSADVKTQVEAYNYMDQEDAQVISTSLNDLEDKIEVLSGRTVDLSGYYTSAQTEEAITSKNYVTSGQVKDQVEAYGYATTGQVNSAFTYINEIEQVTASGYTELHDGLMEVSGRPVFNPSIYYTSAQTEEAITGKNYVTSAQTKTQIEDYHYITSAETKDQIEGYNYVNSGDVKTQVEEYHYVVSGDVKSQVEAYEYVNSGQVETQILAKNYLTAEDIEPDVIYEAEGADPGFYAINSSALTTWQIENLDLSNYNFVRFYIKASDIGFNSNDNFTAPLYVDVVLDPKSLSSQYQAYLGVTSNICAGNRNRSYHVIAAVDITKSKVQLLFQTTLWDISASSAAANGRYCYKIEGYKYNVCGAAENGGGGEAYTAGANINISPANVISVSGLSTINGSAITAGGNIEIQAGGDMSAYWTSAETQSAITSVSGNLQTQIDTIDTVVSDALIDLNARVLHTVKSTDDSIVNIVKIEQTAYNTLVSQSATTSTTLYIVVPDAQ